MSMTAENLATAYRMRNEEDASYADCAEAIGLEREDWHVVKEALKSYTPPPPEPKTALDALEAKARENAARRTLDDDLNDGIKAEMARAGTDKPIGEEEGAQVVRIYNTGGISFKEIGAALNPPRHWLTVSEYLASQGWLDVGRKYPLYSTATAEGAAAWAKEQQDMIRQAAMA